MTPESLTERYGAPIVLTWTRSPNAVRYQVSRRAYPSCPTPRPTVVLGEVVGLRFEDTAASIGPCICTVLYVVTALNNLGHYGQTREVRVDVQ